MTSHLEAHLKGLGFGATQLLFMAMQIFIFWSSGAEQSFADECISGANTVANKGIAHMRSVFIFAEYK